MCRRYFCSQEIDSRHVAERRSTDQSRNGCSTCYFCHAQLFEITHAENIKSPLEQPSCQDAKVVEAFCEAGWRLSAPCRLLVCSALMHSAWPPRRPWRSTHIASRWRHAFHRGRHQHAILIAPTALSAHPAPSCLGAFRTPAYTARGWARHCRHPKCFTEKQTHAWQYSELYSISRRVQSRPAFGWEDHLDLGSTGYFSRA